ncbi:MAG: alpha/beta fold hydrolase [Eudoraea sp.]|nr:alpha/beta fold hydrolase [Eudoraea sp.]NNL01308.1 alpha/beta fold hydrolase [Eudoraea sp.]
MPLVESQYNPPLPFKNGHISTIYSGLIRKVNNLSQQRERLELGDGDFIDLDWSFSQTPSNAVVILLHGLEGHGQRPYITGSARHFNSNGLDSCAVNFRGCSGETNRLFRSYHSGATEDLKAVIQHILSTRKYSSIYIKGFSLGGNLALKYLGEGDVANEIKGAVTVSVPCSLHDSLIQLLKFKNTLYAKRFKKHLIEKLYIKQKKFPELISVKEIETIKTLKDFDDVYTSRAHGFKDALDYYTQCSSLQFLPLIEIPALIINARDDSFLGRDCYPVKEAENNPRLFLDIPKYGGHVGFFDSQNISYSEKIGLKFIKELF